MQDKDTVGYKKPPKKNQFSKGKSGNPRGRPKKSEKTFFDLIEKELSDKITIKHGDSLQTITKRHALIKQLTNKALSGNIPSIRLLLTSSSGNGHSTTKQDKSITKSTGDFNNVKVISDHHNATNDLAKIVSFHIEPFNNQYQIYGFVAHNDCDYDKQVNIKTYISQFLNYTGRLEQVLQYMSDQYIQIWMKYNAQACYHLNISASVPNHEEIRTILKEEHKLSDSSVYMPAFEHMYNSDDRMKTIYNELNTPNIANEMAEMKKFINNGNLSCLDDYDTLTAVEQAMNFHIDNPYYIMLRNIVFQYIVVIDTMFISSADF